MTTEERKDGTDEFVRDAGRLLRQSAEELDAATLSRLKRARQDALAGYDRRAGRGYRFGWQPALGAAVVCATALIAVGLWRAPDGGTSPPAVPVAGAADPAGALEVALGEDDNLEMIEDLEFYDWLGSEPAAAEQPAPDRAG